MVSPTVTPEDGVSGYERDHTQGPACAIACRAGTIYRNYFVEVDGQVGQTAERQIDALRDMGVALGNADERLWAMRNGYAMVTETGCGEIAERLREMTESERDALRGRLRISIQHDTQVTLPGCSHTVTQAYCSALPVTYGGGWLEQWAPFAQLVLDGAYEATLCVAILNAAKAGNITVFLTKLGGGAFGNEQYSGMRRMGWT
ncbi:MAG: hypothetical protein RhofKO_42430 [Rhodothermales bacterium]